MPARFSIRPGVGSLANRGAEMTESNVSALSIEAAIYRLESQARDVIVIADTLALVRSVGRTASTRDAPRLAKLACAAETVLQQIVEGDLGTTPVLLTLNLVALDRMKQILSDIEFIGVEPTGDDRVLHDLLRQAALGAIDDKPSARSEFGLSRAA
jgi:chemotaxis protein histidine kinase CheA